MSERPGFADLLRGLLDDLGRLLRCEIRLARLEAEQKLRQAAAGLWLLGGGLVFAIVSVVLVAQAAVAALTRSLEPWLANLVVAGGAAAICLLLLLAARRSLAAARLKPTRTLRSLSKDADAIEEAIK
ncbi:Putative Holin-X, holin superfamily III [Tistlia consotensis]|uniref:Putative Holin-X, holin superfamily III n=1 Tax=Tistlia consotensis USBA 355 TaxID=560819 RepID=A0A1Y6CUJ4_9PROT|nr:phage holin family protein [Tistlia consotensis]SMF79037.1 Putative Holin-X, holin superfamily III [Tistlia consotensis USBA 355]SNS15639.1 Putative Holin-X, holin superfamily III [Tistlia consotensis]